MTEEDFLTEINAQIERAKLQGRPHVEINAGELHRLVGGYPVDHRMPTCCEAMRKAMIRSADIFIHKPEKGNGASLTVRYIFT